MNTAFSDQSQELLISQNHIIFSLISPKNNIVLECPKTSNKRMNFVLKQKLGVSEHM